MIDGGSWAYHLDVYWDGLLFERATMSGTRVLSEFTKKTLEKLKKR
jgi:hypothetical protein